MTSFRSWLKGKFQLSKAQGKPFTTLKIEQELENVTRNGPLKSLYSQMKSKFSLKKTKVSVIQCTEPVSLKALLGLDVPKLEFGFLDKCEDKERNVLELVADIFADDQLINNDHSVSLDVTEELDQCNSADRLDLCDEEANDYDLRISLDQEYEEKFNILNSGRGLDEETDDDDKCSVTDLGKESDGNKFSGTCLDEESDYENSDVVLDLEEEGNFLYSKQSNGASLTAITDESDISNSSEVLNKEGTFINSRPTPDVFLTEAAMDSSRTTSQRQNDPSSVSSLKSIVYYDPLLDPDYEGVDLDDYVISSN